MLFPFIYVHDLKIGWFTIHPFGLLVAIGVMVGSWLATERARRLGYDLEKLNSFITWILVFGFTGSHILDEIFYHPDQIRDRPWSLLFLWEGISSFGGFIGAIAGSFLWKFFEWKEKYPNSFLPVGWIQRRPTPLSLLPFLDVILSVFPVAWIFGRMGCTVAHDHPGIPASTDSFFAVAYPLRYPSMRIPDSIPHASFGPIEWMYGQYPRYDLGMLELMLTIVLAVLFALTWKRKVPMGSYVIVSALVYAPVRFLMDFLRIAEGEDADPRYLSLTFAQWSCVALFLYGMIAIPYFRQLRLRQSSLLEGIMDSQVISKDSWVAT
ncbi:prolipoprotein diacylglyceryl transferase [Pajaroellobacter abortibovis]|uniref:Prolipoprotein diacylglyceryl transferase n=1 Tax=Pajaroellobacter abortibovis TaxID=1882918 RepID=A0A1L6MXP5_9BACT|nr:prolipoprotein diacylglyceryl transferase family protein [Pajaroellobacter abortibovis]APS00294.1 hypothetical protein BCY86_06060 [Pajaroellobacter abortibovis]